MVCRAGDDIIRHMAIIKATYTRQAREAKASIRYIQHRPGRNGEGITRTLFGMDGALGRWQAYQLIDDAEKGSYFYRFIISPDPKSEDRKRDLFLRELTEHTMQQLAEHLRSPVSWVGTEHADHAPHRHVHVVAIVPQRLPVQELQAMRHVATEAALAQRRHLDLAVAQGREEAGWEQEV